MSTIVLSTNVNAVSRSLVKTGVQVMRLGGLRYMRVRPQGNESLNWFDRLVSAPFVRKFERISEQLSFTFMDIIALRSALDIEMSRHEILDRDMQLDRSLDMLRNGYIKLAQQGQKLRLAVPPQFSAAHLAVGRFISICIECCNEINALQWDVAEHDAPLLGRVQDMEASTQQEMDSLLERITAP